MFSSLNSLRLVFIAFWVGLAVDCHGQTTQTIEVYYEEGDWKTAALAQNKKQKDADGNKLNVEVPACIRVNGGAWHSSQAKRKGSSSWQPMGKKPSLKIKNIEPPLNFGNLWTSDEVVLNNDIISLGYADAYRVYREMGIIAPQAYFAMVKMYRGYDQSGLSSTTDEVFSCADLEGQDDNLELADGPHRYTIIQNLQTYEFLGPNFGNCTYVAWEIEGELEWKTSSGEKAPQSECTSIQEIYDADREEDEEALASAQDSMKDLSNWHFPSLTKYIASDCIIGNYDGPLIHNNNAYVVKSTKDLSCDNVNSQDNHPKCATGGLFYLLPHGMDQTLKCDAYGSFIEKVIDGDPQEVDASTIIFPIKACRASSDCRAAVKREFSRGLESAHRTRTECTDTAYWHYLLMALGTVIGLSSPFLWFGIESNRVSNGRREYILMGVEVCVRIGVIAMLILLIAPIPVYKNDETPLMHYEISRKSEFGENTALTSADFDLIGDWEGTLQRQAWASALRYKGVADTMWRYDDDFSSAFNTFFPDEKTHDNEFADSNSPHRDKNNMYVPACSNRNHCCGSHRIYLGLNMATLCVFFIASMIAVVRNARGNGVYSVVKNGSPFIIAWKSATFFVFLYGKAIYYGTNMQGYYCDTANYDDFHENATVHYGVLFWIAITVGFFLLLDASYEVYLAKKSSGKSLNEPFSKPIAAASDTMADTVVSIYKLIF